MTIVHFDNLIRDGLSQQDTCFVRPRAVGNPYDIWQKEGEKTPYSYIRNEFKIYPRFTSPWDENLTFFFVIFIDYFLS